MSFKLATWWGANAGYVGKALVIVSTVLFLLAAIAWLKNRTEGKTNRLAVGLFIGGSASIFLVFACLASLFVDQQFQYEYVFGHSAAGLNNAYRVAAVWSGQQGSFLLWACTSTIFALVTLKAVGKYQRWYGAIYSIFLAAIAGILAYETPFNLIPQLVLGGQVSVPSTGNGLTPALQNYWVIIHPPTIFFGFGSLTVLFCWAMSAMLTRDLKSWIPMIRPWALLSTSVLGLGLAMGGFWAYETLGWGGFWAWDPVENVSFVPWILTTGFLHGMIVQVTKRRWSGANVLLASLPFVLFVFGTLMTRSGFLGDTSVHSFAEMNRVALWILAGILFSAIGFLTYVYKRIGKPLARQMDLEGEPERYSREAMYRSGVMLLSMLGVTTALGMSWPFFTGLFTGHPQIVEAHLYHLVVPYFFVPIMVLMGLAPFASWRGMPLKDLLMRVVNVVGICLFFTAIAVWLFRTAVPNVPGTDGFLQGPGKMQFPALPLLSFLVALPIFVVVANLWRLIETMKRAPLSIGGFVAHTGLAVMMAGLIISLGFENKERIVLEGNDPTTFSLGDQRSGVYSIQYEGMTEGQDLFNRDNQAVFDVTSSTGEHFQARPGLYYLPNQEEEKAMLWPHIQHGWFRDLYFWMNAPVFTPFKDPIPLKEGETFNAGSDLSMTYEKLITNGKVGKGAEFGVQLKFVIRGKPYTVTPTTTVGADSATPFSILPVGGSLRATVTRMDANTGTVYVMLIFNKPLFPIDVYYKPMTILVWFGAGILFLGGLIAAFYRRFRPRPEQGATASEPASESIENAPVPVAQS